MRLDPSYAIAWRRHSWPKHILQRRIEDFRAAAQYVLRHRNLWTKQHHLSQANRQPSFYLVADRNDRLIEFGIGTYVGI